MSIRKKIFLYFSAVTLTLTGAALFFIYTLFYEYREEEFQQRQKEIITSTLQFLTEIEKIDAEILQALERITIEEIYDEKILLFNRRKELMYESIDDTRIPDYPEILENLSAENPWMEQKDGLYDVVGIYLESGNRSFYGISKAYDNFGYTKLEYLRYVLILTFIGISLVVIFISYFLSKKISNPIVALTHRIKTYNFDKEYEPIQLQRTRDEIDVLTQRFNELMQRMNEAFSFQKHVTHHISHELKTPISILVSNFERIEKENEPQKLRALIRTQKENTKSLSDIIHALLEIAKAESGQSGHQRSVRIDELIFDLAEELNQLYPDFQFAIDYASAPSDDEKLTVFGNPALLRSALMNLMTNSIQYSSDQKAEIIIAPLDKEISISVANNGPVITEAEKPHLFQRFFRGANSQGKRGFGLGLVFIHKILSSHGGKIHYRTEGEFRNVFEVQIPYKS